MGIPKHKPSAKQKSRAKYQSENRLAKNMLEITVEH